jgi:hypothetical protein
LSRLGSTPGYVGLTIMATKEKTKTGKIDKNCLTCSLYLTCENKKKSFTFSCGKYSSFEKAETKKKAKKKEKEKIKKSNIVKINVANMISKI